MKKRLVSVLEVLCLVVTTLPGAALAEEAQTKLNIEQGTITFKNGGYKQGETVTETTGTGPYLVTGDASENRIVVESGEWYVTIQDLTLTPTDGPAIWVKEGATLHLTLEGANSLTGAAGYAGIAVEVEWAVDEYDEYIFDPDKSGIVVIDGDGSLTAQGGNADDDQKTGGGAGIGGNGCKAETGIGGDFGVVEIKSGTINAIGGKAVSLAYGAGAGIGGGGIGSIWMGDYYEENIGWDYSGSITISGGTVKATGGAAYESEYGEVCGAAGIGNGSANSSSATYGETLGISIFGGEINAAGAAGAAGIGGSVDGASGTIVISDAKVTATGLDGGAGIGGGVNAGSGPITIKGGAKVTATGGEMAAGIGGGYGGGAETINISENAVVTARGGVCGAGIGGGYGGGGYIWSDASCGEILITDNAKVYAYGGKNAEAIGFGDSRGEVDDYEKETISTLTLGENITLWAQTQTASCPALLDYTDDGADPVVYHSDSGQTYLVVNDPERENVANGYLEQPGEAARTFSYQFSETDEGTKTLTLNGTVSAAAKPEGTVANWATIYKAAEITLEPVSITAYVGGTSMSGNATPTLRWLVTLPEGVQLETVEDGAPKISALEMTLHTTGSDNEPVEIPLSPQLIPDSKPVSDDHHYYYYFPALESGLHVDTENDLEGDYLKLEDVSSVKGRAGRYKITLVEEPPWSLTAKYGETTYSVTINIPDEVQITTRYISDEDMMYQSPGSVLTQVVNTDDAVDTSAEKAVAVIPEGAIFYTNGESSGLGLVGNTEKAEPIIALLFDDTVTLTNQSGDSLSGEDLESMMIEHAGHAKEYGAAANYSFDGWDYDFRYLDLVNVNDGNAWVSCDQDITIYWPYPEGVSGSGYEFQVLHYKGMDRDEDYAIDSLGNSAQWLETAMHSEEYRTVVEEIAVEPTENGLKFTLAADSSGNNMSPFVLMWKAVTGASSGASGGASGGGTTRYYLHYESNVGTEYADERYASGTTVRLEKVPVREGYAFTGWYADEALTDPIDSVKMTGNKTVYAGWRASSVPDMLNGDDHFAYVIGYTDGTVRPLANISRVETAALFFRLLTAEVRDGSLTSANTFDDVPDGMWCSTPVSTLAALGIVKGRGADVFDPDAPITRAEFAAICARFDTGRTNGDSDFSDISGSWAEEEIERAASLGWVTGYPDGTFRPDQPITRAEAMTIIDRVLGRIPEDESDLLPGMKVWPDNAPGEWYYLAVQEATNSHEYAPKGESNETWTKLTDDPNWKRYENAFTAEGW